MNQNAQYQQNYSPHPGRQIVSNLTVYLWCAEIWYYIYTALYIFLMVSLHGALEMYIIFGINFVLAGLAIAGCQLCRRNINSVPMNLGSAKTWYSVMVGVSCFLAVFYLAFAILLFNSKDSYGIGVVFGGLFVILGIPFLIVSLIGFWFCGSFSKIIGGYTTGLYREDGYDMQGYQY